MVMVSLMFSTMTTTMMESLTLRMIILTTMIMMA